MTESLQERCEAVDEEEFLEHLIQFPDQVQSGDEIGRRCPDVPDFSCQSVLVCGMGGSGITGDLLSRLTVRSLRVPVVTNKHYTVPNWVDEQTLVLLISYSGTTEETLSCYHEARKRNARPVILTSNGELEVHGRENDYPVIAIPPDMPPRASTGYLLLPALHLFASEGLASAPDRKEIRSTCERLVDLVEELSPEGGSNRALDRARELEGTLPLLIGSEPFTGCLADRFRNQLHETAKTMAVSARLPELHHNQVMAWDHLAGFEDPPVSAVFLRDRDEHPRVQKRFRFTRERFRELGIPVSEVQGNGGSLLGRFLTLMLYTDFISYYLAIQRNKDPHDVEAIERLKSDLSSDPS